MSTKTLRQFSLVVSALAIAAVVGAQGGTTQGQEQGQQQGQGTVRPLPIIRQPATAGPSMEERMKAVKEFEGKKLPDFEMKLLNDKVLKNKDLEGKVTIIDFWATWCGPCKAAAPKLEELYKEYKDKGLVIVGANLAERDSEGQPLLTKDKAVNYQKEHGYSYTFTYGNDAIGKAWKVPGYPTFFIADRNGVVKEVMVGFNEKRMRELVAELTAK